MADPFHIDVRQLNAYAAEKDPSEDVPSPQPLRATVYDPLVGTGVVKVGRHRPTTTDARE